MPDRAGVRYLRTRRERDPNDPDSVAGTLYRREFPDKSSHQVWVPDHSVNPPIPRWVQQHLDANDWDGGNVRNA